MDLRQLRIFCKVVEKGSFRKASDVLNLSQPSVSQNIAALEDEYKVMLFKRKGRGVEMTPHGRALFSFAEEVLQLSDSIPRHFSEMESLQRGSLIIGTTQHIAESLLPDVIKEYKNAFPKINITILTGNANRIINQVLDGQVEIGIIGKALTHSYESELERVSLGFERLYLSVQKGHPWEKRDITPKELLQSDLSIARYTNDHPLGFLVDDFLLRNKIELRNDMIFNSVYLAAKFVAEGVCVAILSEDVAMDRRKSSNLGIAFLEGLSQVMWETELISSKVRGISFAGWEMEKRIEEAAKLHFKKMD